MRDGIKMRLNTIVTLGASAAFGLMAVFLARGWINDAVENEYRQVNPPMVTELTMSDFATVPVLVADLDLAFGDILSREAVRLVHYPEDAVPSGAYNDFDSVFDTMGDRVVLSALVYNEPILEQKITGPNGKASLSARIRPGYRAVAVRVDDVSGVAGFVVPGDVVDVIYTRVPESAANNRIINAGATSAFVSDVLLQNITVLGVDQNQSDVTTSASVARTVTLEVTNEDGQALSLAMQYGNLSLTLRGVGEIQPSLARQLKLSDLGPRQVPTHKNPEKRVKTVIKSTPLNLAEVTVIRGGVNEERVQQISVRRDATINEKLANDATSSLSELAGG